MQNYPQNEPKTSKFDVTIPVVICIVDCENKNKYKTKSSELFDSTECG